MESPKELLIEYIDRTDESQLTDVLKTALSIRLAGLQQERSRIAQEIEKMEAQLQELSGRQGPAAQAGPRPRSKPRTSEIVRQTLRSYGRPLPLDAIVRAVSKETGRPLTNSLRSYIGQLLQREPAVKRLSRGLYAISM